MKRVLGWKNDVESKIRDAKVWEVAYKLPKDCTVSKCVLLRKWFNATGVNIDAANLRSLRPANTDTVTLDNFDSDSDLFADQTREIRDIEKGA